MLASVATVHFLKTKKRISSYICIHVKSRSKCLHKEMRATPLTMHATHDPTPIFRAMH